MDEDKGLPIDLIRTWDSQDILIDANTPGMALVEMTPEQWVEANRIADRIEAGSR